MGKKRKEKKKNSPKFLPRHGVIEPRAGESGSNVPGELHVVVHKSDALGVHGEVVGHLEVLDEEGLGRLLQGLERVPLPANLLVRVAVGNLLDEAAERQSGDEQLARLLVRADLAEGGDAWGAAADRLGLQFSSRHITFPLTTKLFTMQTR